MEASTERYSPVIPASLHCGGHEMPCGRRIHLAPNAPSLIVLVQLHATALVALVRIVQRVQYAIPLAKSAVH
jgi:hypothetical protein